MNKKITLLVIVIGAFQLTGCSVISMHAASTRMEEARSTNAGKQLVPKDGGTYLIVVGQETGSYLGSGDTDWKINNSSFTQPRGTYSVVRVRPGTYTAYGNKRVAGGGEGSKIRHGWHSSENPSEGSTSLRGKGQSVEISPRGGETTNRDHPSRQASRRPDWLRVRGRLVRLQTGARSAFPGAYRIGAQKSARGLRREIGKHQITVRSNRGQG